MLYNYATQRVAYEIELTDMDATVYIPQYKEALDTYRWYREVKGYSVRKSIRLTEKYWKLNSSESFKSIILATALKL
jgi:hypothetical protein